MRASIGNALLLNLVVLIISAVIVLFVSTLAYSKAYRVKNRIIEIIEKNGGYRKVNKLDEETDIELEISTFLHQVGYQLGRSNNCSSHLAARGVNVENSENIIYDSKVYKYCVGKKESSLSGETYVVVTYVEFNVPILGNIGAIPISGETRILNKNYNNYD